MTTVAMSSLEWVRSGLFATLEDIEQALDQLLAEQGNEALLEQVRENLLQVRGTLRLIELSSADFLLQEIYRLLGSFQQASGLDSRLPALLSALHALRRHLECRDTLCWQSGEFLLPTINELRRAHGEAELPESFFFRTKAAAIRPQVAPTLIDSDHRAILAKRLRQMYQVGLLGVLREQGAQASIKLMARAFERLDRLFAGTSNDRLFWLAAAVLEAFASNGLLLRKSRSRLFSRLDRELRQRLADTQHESAKEYKELLYLAALSENATPRITELRKAFELPPLPFSDRELEEHGQSLARPDGKVMHSLTLAVREELTSIQEIVDLIGRNTHGEESLTSLRVQLGLLANTLSMIGLPLAGKALNAQITHVEQWTRHGKVPAAELSNLADSLLLVESLLARLERGEVREAQQGGRDEQMQAFIRQQLTEARIAAIDEARLSLVEARKALMGWLESGGDKTHLAEVPENLASVCGGLWFLGQTRVLHLVHGCRDYIQKQILEAQQMPSEQQLETLADALTSLEYYLESGSALQQTQLSGEALLLAASSLESLGVSLAR